MMKSSRGNRLSSNWQCPHCRTPLDSRSFRLSPTDASKLVCPHCGRQFHWSEQNEGRLWPEQRAYSVLRSNQVRQSTLKDRHEVHALQYDSP